MFGQNSYTKSSILSPVNQSGEFFSRRTRGEGTARASLNNRLKESIGASVVEKTVKHGFSHNIRNFLTNRSEESKSPESGGASE